MALMHMDGMDLYRDWQDANTVYSTNETPNFSTSLGRFGGGCIIAGGSDNFSLNLPSTVTTGDRLWLAFAFFQDGTITSSGTFVTFFTDDGGSTLELFYEDSSQQFEISDETNSVIGTFTVAQNVWNWIEIESEYGSTTATLIIRLNGTDVYNSTADTDDPGANGYSSIQFGGLFGSNIRFDDIIVGDSTGTENTSIPGDTKIVTLLPDGAGASSDFTANGAATNHEAADDAPTDGDTTYNSSSTSGDRDTFSFEDLPETPDAVIGVQKRIAARKEGTGALAVRAVLTSGTTTDVGATKGLSNFYQFSSEIYDTDPDTGSPWTEAGVNAIKAGYEIP